jgi:outer membrane scaffolding protein for murein synthesis (MipA/OmpV family)
MNLISKAAFQGLMFLAFVCFVSVPEEASAQTPSPLQEWQYPGGSILEKVFLPELPKWSEVAGLAVLEQPIYEGARGYRVEVGPVIDIRYYDIAFLSVGEGLGVNLLRGKMYEAGVALGYDLGRRDSDDYNRLHGLGDIGRAPVVKVFGSWVVSEKVPVVLRADLRKIVGGAEGIIGDLEAFMPLPGSNKTFIMLAGPSITFANRQFMGKEFGVTAAQSAASGYSAYSAHGGDNELGLGFSATKFVTPHWLFNCNIAVNRLLGSARDSPITQTQAENTLEIASAYRW